MKKTFKVNDLDCAHCVNDAAMNFLAQKLMVEAEDSQFDAIMKEVVKVCKKVEPDCEIVLK